MKTKFQCLLLAALISPAFGAQPGAVLTVLHSFHVARYGANPCAALVQGSEGYFYGTCSGGGTNGGLGTVLRISTNGVLSTLYSFAGVDGARPCAALVQGSDGYFYGTCSGGGTNGDIGTVFRISATGVLTTLYSFTGSNDGGAPVAALVRGSDGYFYGTCSGGGTNASYGTIFRISTNGVLTSLYSFTGGSDGANPYAALVQGSDEYFYGTCGRGGTYGSGTVFRVSTNGVLTTLYHFTGSSDGGYPQAVVQGSDGYFYGTCEGGGTSGGYGTVFKVSTNGALTTLHSFTGNDGGYPQAGLVQGTDGYFYGTTERLYGTVFRISTNGTLTTLHTFGDLYDGAYIAPIQKKGWSSKAFEYGTWGGEIRSEFEPHPGDIVAAEHWCSSGFANTDLDLQLKKHGIHQIIIIGLIAHTCIEATVRYAAELGYEVTVVKDATADYSQEEMHAALDINIPNYANAVVTADEVVHAISSFETAAAVVS